MLGEYAVLEGAPAFCIAIDRRAKVEITPLPDSRCEILAPDIEPDPVPLFIAANGLPDWQEAGARATRLSLVDQTIRGLVQQGRRLRFGQGFRLRLDTSAFFSSIDGNRLKLGLGSSAALTVALANSLAAFITGSAGDTPLLGLAPLLRLHRDFQGGHGSGVDVASSLVGGALIYRVPGGGAPPKAEVVKWPSGLHSLFVFSGRSASTPEFLARLSDWRASNADEYRMRMNLLIAIAAAAETAIRANDAAAFLECASAYTNDLQSLGAASNVNILSVEHAQIAAIARNSGVLYKSCGAGGGDIGVALALDPRRLEQLRPRLEQAGFSCIPLALDEVGLRLQSGQGVQA